MCNKKVLVVGRGPLAAEVALRADVRHGDVARAHGADAALRGLAPRTLFVSDFSFVSELFGLPWETSIPDKGP